jgi:hypothetical protein
MFKFIEVEFVNFRGETTSTETINADLIGGFAAEGSYTRLKFQNGNERCIRASYGWLQRALEAVIL